MRRNIVFFAVILLLLLSRIWFLYQQQKSVPPVDQGLHDVAGVLDAESSVLIDRSIDECTAAGIPVCAVVVRGTGEIQRDRFVPTLFGKFNRSLEVPDSGILVVLMADELRIYIARGERLKYIVDDPKNIDSEGGVSKGESVQITTFAESIADYLSKAAKSVEAYRRLHFELDAKVRQADPEKIPFLTLFFICLALGIGAVIYHFRNRCPACGKKCTVTRREIRSQDASAMVEHEIFSCPACGFTRERKIVKR